MLHVISHIFNHNHWFLLIYTKTQTFIKIYVKLMILMKLNNVTDEAWCSLEFSWTLFDKIWFGVY